GPGSRSNVVALVGTRDLVLTVAQVVHVAEHGSSGWQILRLREQRVEHVFAVRRVVDQVAALEGAGGILIPVQAHERSLVIQGRLSRDASPVLDKAQEVVDAAIHAESKFRSLGGVVESDGLTAGDGRTVVGCDRNPVGLGGRATLPAWIEWIYHAAAGVLVAGGAGCADR